MQIIFSRNNESLTVNVIPAGAIQIATQGEGVPGLHTLTMSNAATAGGAIVQYAQGQDTQFFVPGLFITECTVSGNVSAYSGHGVIVEDAARKRELRLLKNREAARECRRKKKEYIKCLENRVAVLENRNKTLIDELKSLKELYQKKSD
ncbi:cyclic AMP-responsive element-binding protein 1 [Prorops nasuta]|uniref:cyclic AMP-responsive element-binding protein 1 n=1 Tax=Prorops nasuta TaxID=863751 RepID=UPI0034CD7B41